MLQKYKKEMKYKTKLETYDKLVTNRLQFGLLSIRKHIEHSHNLQFN